MHIICIIIIIVIVTTTIIKGDNTIRIYHYLTYSTPGSNVTGSTHACIRIFVADHVILSASVIAQHGY